MENMRHIDWKYMAMLAVVPMFSCTGEEAPEEEPRHAIDFVCNDFGSRSDIHAEMDDLKTKGFKLFVHNTHEPESATPTTAASFVRDVTYTASTDAWDYENKMYWIPQYTFQFRGYFPADALDINDTGYNNYEFYYNNTTQKDIMMASATKSHAKAQEDGFKAVDMPFEHLLAKVNINLKVDTQVDGTPKLGAIVKGIGLSGVAQKAKYTNDAWTGHYGKTDIGRNFESPVLIGESIFGERGKITLKLPDGEKICEEEKELLVIPQELKEGDVTLQLYVDIITPPVWYETEGNYNYSILMQDQPLVCNIPAIEWESRKKYVYTVTITQNFEISFDVKPTGDNPTIVPWEDKSMSGTIIIK